MKLSTKVIALLLAMIVMMVTFVACTEEELYDPDEDEEQSETDKKGNDDDEDDDSSKNDKYSNLTPGSAFAALKKADKGALGMKMDANMAGLVVAMDVNLVKGDSLVHMAGEMMVFGMADTEESYYDLSNQKVYSTDDDGNWYWSELGEDEGWEAVLDSLSEEFLDGENYLFDDANYTKDGKRYTMKPNVLEEYMSEEDGTTIDTAEAYMTVDGTLYTYVLKASGKSEGEKVTSELTITVDFSTKSIKIPQEVLDAPYGDGMDEDEEGDEAPEDYLSPEEIYSVIKKGKNISLDISDSESSIAVEKDGDIIRIRESVYDEDYSAENIYDLGKGVRYYYDYDKWEWICTKIEDFSWDEFVEILVEYTNGTMALSNDNFAYDDFFEEYELKDSKLDDYGCDFVTIEKNEYEDFDGNTIEYYCYMVSCDDGDVYITIDVEIGTASADDILSDID